VKNNDAMGSLYRSQHELISVFKNGRSPHINDIKLGSRGRHRTNVWTYPNADSFGSWRRMSRRWLSSPYLPKINSAI
jgi:hypothetical protein